ncbi:hypothetical protein QBC36DRAFT_26438 [Triangularia setosa]|uniref:Uncharacterized protein n=1 Tax=Triangularia setosa TaxID=2587417 RepID=A0AAN7ABX0_9PEZI|nr:hypothetical protein QBC36DRAFT_26438 [Podospora setosa]
MVDDLSLPHNREYLTATVPQQELASNGESESSDPAVLSLDEEMGRHVPSLHNSAMRNLNYHHSDISTLSSPIRLHRPSNTIDSSASLIEPSTLTRENTAISQTVTTRMAITTRKDNGQEFQEAFLRERELTIPQNRETVQPESRGLLKAMKMELDDALVRGTHGADEWFIPCTSLISIVHADLVTCLINECQVVIPEQRRELVDRIYARLDDTEEHSGSFRTLLAILILIDKHHSILEFISHEPPIHDSVLPLHMVTKGTKDRPAGLAVKSPPSTITPFTSEWTAGEIRAFNRKQWEFFPIFFSYSGKGRRYKSYQSAL